MYIPRGYLHKVTTVESLYDDENAYSVHLSIGLEVDTLGFTIESFMFCSMGIALEDEDKMEKFQRLTWLSGYLWQWTFMKEETRRIFPFFESEYLLQRIAENQDDETLIDELQKFQKKLYEETSDLIEQFEIALNHTKGVKTEELEQNAVPEVSISDIKTAHNIFHGGLERLRRLFMAKMSLLKDSEFEDVLDRNSKFDELMVEEITNVYKKCGVPFDIVGDGESEFTFKTN